MKKAILFFPIFFLPVLSFCAKKTNSATEALTLSKAQMVYRSLDPKSILQQFAYYELYPETEEGKKALRTAWQLIFGQEVSSFESFTIPSIDVASLINLITKQSDDTSLEMSLEQLSILEKASERLKNRSLKGHKILETEEALKLESDEIDLARTLFIYQFQNDTDKEFKIRSYEASIDLMALQILAKIKNESSPEEIVEQINQFIFREMRFRFPPHSLYAKDIDVYTFLPSVIDSRQGVCLGVSTLYLCIAQRIGLDLSIVTPPGHIYVCYDKEGKHINIETTARGIHLPDETYLGINTKSLHKRKMKEVVGMAFFNQASVMNARQEYEKALELYQRAYEYIPDDPLVKMLLGMHYLFTGDKKHGTYFLKQVQGKVFDGAVSVETLPDDYLKGYVDIEGLKMVFMPVDETRESIISKQKEIKALLKKYPKFRAGIMQLAISYLQLGRSLDAYQILLQYHRIDPSNPIVEYYLSIICLQRLNYPEAWAFYRSAEKIVHGTGHFPKALKSLKSSLQKACPCPS